MSFISTFFGLIYTIFISDSLYHCVVRDNGMFHLYEESMDYIDCDKIHIVKENRNSIVFHDGLHEYSFLLSKSTLTKRFETKRMICQFDVPIWDDPLMKIQELMHIDDAISDQSNQIIQTIYLPLYSWKTYAVAEKSGLNQWNAKGRKRHPDEVYILIPREIHKNFSDFFPGRDTPFMLKLPNGVEMKSKVCQDGNKALMSYSNKELGRWILREVLQLPEGEIVTYEKLQRLGIDAVRIDKLHDGSFEINFAETGSYDVFRQSWG